MVLPGGAFKGQVPQQDARGRVNPDHLLKLIKASKDDFATTYTAKTRADLKECKGMCCFGACACSTCC